VPFQPERESPKDVGAGEAWCIRCEDGLANQPSEEGRFFAPGLGGDEDLPHVAWQLRRTDEPDDLHLVFQAQPVLVSQ